MHLVKRLEIIVSSPELHKILDCLDTVGVQNYSVIRDVVGKGRSGAVSDDSDFAATTLSDVYVLAFCAEERMRPAVEGIRPLLNKFGGTLYISDAMEVRSVRCVAS